MRLDSFALFFFITYLGALLPYQSCLYTPVHQQPSEECNSAYDMHLSVCVCVYVLS